jgi:MarR family transcriptional regulator, 2-MHQ and catechol-resistance regulon repressor
MSSCEDARIHAFGVTLEALTRLNHVFDRSLKEQIGLGQGWFEALLRIERSGGFMTMGELAEQVSLTSGGVTRLVDRLVESGYAERKSCATDRRVQYVSNTDAGRSILERALEVHLVDLQREFIDRISPEELEVIVAVMDRLRKPAAEVVGR